MEVHVCLTRQRSYGEVPHQAAEAHCRTVRLERRLLSESLPEQIICPIAEFLHRRGRYVGLGLVTSRLLDYTGGEFVEVAGLLGA